MFEHKDPKKCRKVFPGSDIDDVSSKMSRCSTVPSLWFGVAIQQNLWIFQVGNRTPIYTHSIDIPKSDIPKHQNLSNIFPKICVFVSWFGYGGIHRNCNLDQFGWDIMINHGISIGFWGTYFLTPHWNPIARRNGSNHQTGGWFCGFRCRNGWDFRWIESEIKINSSLVTSEASFLMFFGYRWNRWKLAIRTCDAYLLPLLLRLRMAKSTALNAFVWVNIYPILSNQLCIRIVT